MKWYAISGSWRKSNKEVEKDVKEIVRKIVLAGEGVITGGALGVDYFATQIIIELNTLNQLKIYLPIKLDEFCKHYFKRAVEGVISQEQAEMITKQLNYIANKCKKCIIDSPKFKEANIESYYARNTQIIKACDVLYAFQVNDSKGTQDAIDKAKSLGKKVNVKKYSIE